MKTLLPPEITRANWLIKAGDLETGQYLKLYPMDDLTWQAAVRALDAAYGKDNKFVVIAHGNSLQVGRGR